VVAIAARVPTTGKARRRRGFVQRDFGSRINSNRDWIPQSGGEDVSPHVDPFLGVGLHFGGDVAENNGGADAFAGHDGGDSGCCPDSVIILL